MKKILTILLMAILASLLIGCGGSSSSDEDTGSYNVLVKINDASAGGVTVNLGTDYSCITDSFGVGTIRNIEPGTYNITIIKDGQTIETGKTTTIYAGERTQETLKITI